MIKFVEVMDLALEEAGEAVDWYRDRDELAAQGFAEEYTEAINAIGEHWNSFPSYLHGTKRRMFSAYPYQLVFRELSDRVQVVAVAHLRRKPGYWKRRLK